MSNISQRKEKVLVIGLDGVTFDLIEPWVAQGKLPNLKSLMQKGAWGRLKSTQPAHSAPAWTSCVTGVNPGKHGITSFFHWDAENLHFFPVNARDIRYPPLWKVLNAHGQKVGILNLPVGYPPPELNGYAVSGMMAPNLETACYPASLKDELLDVAPDYEIEAPIHPNRKATLDGIYCQIEARETAAHYLREHYPTDFTMVIFTGSDRLQHFYWADMDRQHPAHKQVADQGLGNAIELGYQKLDQAVGRLLERSVEDTTVIVLSDHGFLPIYRRFFVNLWLKEQGLLALKTQRLAVIETFKRWIFRLGLRRFASKVKQRLPGAENLRIHSLSFSAVDWNQTSVLFGPTMGLTFNLRGREKNGIVQQETYIELQNRLIRSLKEIRYPDTGELIVEDVQPREIIYHGDAVPLAPDLRVQMSTHRSGDWIGQYIHQRGFEPGPIIRGPDHIHAGHAPDGIFIAYGPNVNTSACIENAQIIDIAPTILYTMGLPVPTSMDGSILFDIFSKNYRETHPPDYSDGLIVEENQRYSYGDKETELIEGRLRDLGYLR